MRRILCAALIVASSVGIIVVPAMADSSSSNVLPGATTGLVRMFAVAPASTNASNIVCRFQWVNQSQAECAFNFPDNGVWTIHAQYEVVPQTDVVDVAVTNLRVLN